MLPNGIQFEQYLVPHIQSESKLWVVLNDEKNENAAELGPIFNSSYISENENRNTDKRIQTY